MRHTIVAASILLAAGAAIANPVAHQGENWVMLSDKPCTPAIAQRVRPEVAPMLREARVMLEGKPYVACWLRQGLSVRLAYEDGDEGDIDVRSFHDAPSI
jgi:hypothetical protein